MQQSSDEVQIYSTTESYWPCQMGALSLWILSLWSLTRSDLLDLPSLPYLHPDSSFSTTEVVVN